MVCDNPQICKHKTDLNYDNKYCAMHCAFPIMTALISSNFLPFSLFDLLWCLTLFEGSHFFTFLLLFHGYRFPGSTLTFTFASILLSLLFLYPHPRLFVFFSSYSILWRPSPKLLHRGFCWIYWSTSPVEKCQNIPIKASGRPRKSAQTVQEGHVLHDGR